MQSYHQRQFLTLPDRPIAFASRSEMACGLLLEKYIKGFELKMGETFQVLIGFNKHADFKVERTYIEYHPIILRNEFDNSVAFRQLTSALKHVKRHQREEIEDAVKSELTEQYYRKRKFCLRHTDPSAELVVCGSSYEFCRSIIKRFCVDSLNIKKLLSEFDDLCKGEK